jgi:excisionase family DNA binding protein
MFGLDNQSEFGGIETLEVKRGVPSTQRSLKYWEQWKLPDDWPHLLNVMEAAAYLRVSQDVVCDALHIARDGRARLAHHRFGRRIIIRRSDLDAFSYVEGRARA